jgi:glycerate 2-kinase
MRVIIATDEIAALTSAEAGKVLATGWPEAATEVVPMGEASAGFLQAVADLHQVEPVVGASGDAISTVVDAPEVLAIGVEPQVRDTTTGIDRRASSEFLGIACREAIEASRHRADEIVVDVSSNRAHDGGAGFLSALGADADVALTGGVAGLAGVGRVDLAPVRELLAGRRLTLVVPEGQQDLPLLGLRGITSRFGREQGWSPEMLLATDASLQAFTAAAADGRAERHDWGACGGIGFAAHALDGVVATGSQYCADRSRLQRRLAAADLLVTGCSVFDFARRGGGVVKRIADHAEQANVPVILIAGEVMVGSREMRAMGIESAYAVQETRMDRPTGDVGTDDLAATVGRVARSWSW